MAVLSGPELIQEMTRPRAHLARRACEAADNERQLERYPADLRETLRGVGRFLTKPLSPLDLSRLVDRLSGQSRST